jgi:two-component system, sensor histidine kinase and response regulator
MNPTHQPESQVVPILLEGKRALLVDDDPHFLGFLVHLLKKNGVECIEASDGLGGMKVLASENVDFILSDIDMPGMDGYEFLSSVRRQPQFEALPFILLTGKPAYSGLLSGLRHGADSYLPKPFDEPTILETISNCLRRLKRQEEQATSKFDEQRVNVLKMLPHELRTPLNGILGVADLLEMGEAEPEELRVYAEVLRTSGERMLRLTTNFLLCAELQMQAESPQKATPIFGDDTNCDAQNMAVILQQKATDAGRSELLQLEIAPGSPAVPSQALAKMLDEILDNALKISNLEDPVSVTGEVVGDIYRWRVVDHGRGFPNDPLESGGLFIQFDRKTHEQQGAGMGLHLVGKLCAHYGGTLKFLPTPGGGTTVELNFPLAPKEQ